MLIGGLVVMAKRLLPDEELEEDYPEQEHSAEQERIVQVVEESGLTRRRLRLDGAALANGIHTDGTLTVAGGAVTCGAATGSG